jgi:hydrogenase expression/formation protein HypE
MEKVEMTMENVTLGHGSGGRLSLELTRRILSHFDLTEVPFEMEDCAFIDKEKTLAVTTDGFTVSPPVFPGGDIGKLAVCGSTNDLAVRGVRPEFLTLSLILEEGLPLEELDGYMQSAAAVCQAQGVRLTAGDTKVTPKGMSDRVFITACALGHRMTPVPLGIGNLRPGDALLLTNPPGQHGAVLAALRFGLETPGLVSDCAPLWPILRPLMGLPGLRAMRDCTRGGLGTALCEWIEGTSMGVEIEERLIPNERQAASICDILGFELLWLAGEGCALIAVDPSQAGEALDLLRTSPHCAKAAQIGRIVEDHPGFAAMRTQIGGTRLIDMPAGEVLPRLC